MAKYFYVSNETSGLPKQLYSVSSILRVTELESSSDPETHILLSNEIGRSVKGKLLDVLAQLESDALYVRLEPVEEKEVHFGWI